MRVLYWALLPNGKRVEVWSTKRMTHLSCYMDTDGKDTYWCHRFHPTERNAGIALNRLLRDSYRRMEARGDTSRGTYDFMQPQILPAYFEIKG